MSNTQNMHIKQLSFLFFFILGQQLFSQTCCSGGIPLSNSLGLPNEGKGSLQFSVSYDYNNLNTLNFESTRLNDSSRQRITHSALVNIGYSVTDKFSIEGLITAVNQRRAISQFDNFDLQQTFGIGDAIFLTKYNFSNLLGKKSDFTLGAGVKIPLGSYEEVSPIGITYVSDLQPGSGAWDMILFSSISKNFDFRPTATFSIRGIGRFTGNNNNYLQGASSYQYGNEIQVFLGVADQFLFLNNIMSPSLFVKYRKAGKDLITDIPLSNTGGNWLFVIPGIGFQLAKNILFQTKFELPILSKVEGTQLTPTYRLTTGFVFKFNSKNNLNL